MHLERLRFKPKLPMCLLHLMHELLIWCNVVNVVDM